MSREHRIPIMFSAEELAAIDEHRFTNRIASRAAAVRSLCLAGLSQTDDRTTSLAALRRAEDFIAGFEDDETQEGVPTLLGEVRAAITKMEGRSDG